MPMIALAPPAIFFHQIIVADDETKRRDILAIRDAIRKLIPGAQVTITPPHLRQRPGIDWERWPLDWNGMWIWIKRPEVYDQPWKKREMESA